MKIIVHLALIVCSLGAFAQGTETCVCVKNKSYPVPPTGDETLLYIQRTPNSNTIMYDLNAKNGVVDEDEPVHAYWIRYGEQGQKEELSYIQRNYAYGLKTEKLKDGSFEVKFVSYKKLPLYLIKSSRDKRYHIQATINGKKIDVSQVYLQIEGGSFWFPNVVCAEVRGVDPVTGEEVIQTFKP